MIDVGCSGGIDEILKNFGDKIIYYGFDPDVKEVGRLRLDNLNIQKVLKRGFAIVRDAKDKKIVKTSNVNKEHLVNIEFYDGILTAKTQKKQ